MRTASMRPRQMPRNFWLRGRRERDRLRASMRPRQMPRNFYTFWAIRITPIVCFNEAAADAAEFFGEKGRAMAESKCFNEAAADAAEFFAHGEFRTAVEAWLQ